MIYQKFLLDGLITMKGGGTPSKKIKEYWDGDIPWASVKDLTSTCLSKTQDYITKAGLENSNSNLIPEGSIILATRMAVGRVCINDFPVAINQDLRALFCSDKILSKYLLWFLLSSTHILENQASGATVKGITLDAIKNLEVPLPSIEEQKRIAAILDKADRIRRKRQEAIRLTEELGRSIFLDMFGDPVTNPKGWEIVEIDQIVDAIESGWSPKCDSRIAEHDEWGVLKLGAITWGTFNEQENKALLPGTMPKPEVEVQPGDLLFTRKNTYELVGASVYVHKTRSKLLLPDLIFRLKVNSRVNPIYLWQALSQSSMRQEISLLASGSSGSMPNISKARLRTLKVALPSLELQNKFSRISEKYWEKQDSLEEYKKQAENLFNSLLQKAFRGEL